MLICPNCGKPVSEPIPCIMNIKCSLCGQENSSDKLLIVADSEKVNNLYAKFDELYLYLVRRSSDIGSFLISLGIIEKDSSKEGIYQMAILLRSLTRVTFEEILRYVMREGEKTERTNPEAN